MDGENRMGRSALQALDVLSDAACVPGAAAAWRYYEQYTGPGRYVVDVPGGRLPCLPRMSFRHEFGTRLARVCLINVERSIGIDVTGLLRQSAAGDARASCATPHMPDPAMCRRAGDAWECTGQAVSWSA